MRWLDSVTDSVDMNLSKLRETVKDSRAWGTAVHGVPKVGYDGVTSLSLFTFIRWRMKWHPTPVLLPGESQGWGSLVGCRLWGRRELDTTEAT